jgi:hypothetical protein
VQPQAVTLQLASAVAVASVRAMVKQGGSETAENDGSKLLNVAHLNVSGLCLVAAATLRAGAVIPTPPLAG